MKSLQSQHVHPFPATLDTQKSGQISRNLPLSNFKGTSPTYSTNATSCEVHCNAWYAPFSLPYLKWVGIEPLGHTLVDIEHLWSQKWAVSLELLPFQMDKLKDSLLITYILPCSDIRDIAIWLVPPKFWGQNQIRVGHQPGPLSKWVWVQGYYRATVQTLYSASQLCLSVPREHTVFPQRSTFLKHPLNPQLK